MPTFPDSTPSSLAGLEADVAALKTDLPAEALARVTADDALGVRIDGETAARIAGDESRFVWTEQEVAARQLGDESLNERLGNEILARASGDLVNFDRAAALEIALRQALGEVIAVATWADLDAVDKTKILLGRAGKVYGPDAAQHTDPVSALLVNNEGVYTLTAQGWKRLVNLEVADVTALVGQAQGYAADSLASYVGASGAVTTALDGVAFYGGSAQLPMWGNVDIWPPATNNADSQLPDIGERGFFVQPGFSSGSTPLLRLNTAFRMMLQTTIPWERIYRYEEYRVAGIFGSSARTWSLNFYPADYRNSTTPNVNHQRRFRFRAQGTLSSAGYIADCYSQQIPTTWRNVAVEPRRRASDGFFGLDIINLETNAVLSGFGVDPLLGTELSQNGSLIDLTAYVANTTKICWGGWFGTDTVSPTTGEGLERTSAASDIGGFWPGTLGRVLYVEGDFDAASYATLRRGALPETIASASSVKYHRDFTADPRSLKRRAAATGDVSLDAYVVGRIGPGSSLMPKSNVSFATITRIRDSYTFGVRRKAKKARCDFVSIVKHNDDGYLEARVLRPDGVVMVPAQRVAAIIAANVAAPADPRVPVASNANSADGTTVNWSIVVPRNKGMIVQVRIEGTTEWWTDASDTAVGIKLMRLGQSQEANMLAATTAKRQQYNQNASINLVYSATGAPTVYAKRPNLFRMGLELGVDGFKGEASQLALEEDCRVEVCIFGETNTGAGSVLANEINNIGGPGLFDQVKNLATFIGPNDVTAVAFDWWTDHRSFASLYGEKFLDGLVFGQGPYVWRADAGTLGQIKTGTNINGTTGGSGGTDGAGYALGITGGGGSGATGTFTVAAGRVSAMQFPAGGSGFTSQPVLDFSSCPGLTGVAGIGVTIGSTGFNAADPWYVGTGERRWLMQPFAADTPVIVVPPTRHNAVGGPFDFDNEINTGLCRDAAKAWCDANGATMGMHAINITLVDQWHPSSLVSSGRDRFGRIQAYAILRETSDIDIPPNFGVKAGSVKFTDGTRTKIRFKLDIPRRYRGAAASGFTYLDVDGGGNPLAIVTASCQLAASGSSVYTRTGFTAYLVDRDTVEIVKASGSWGAGQKLQVLPGGPLAWGTGGTLAAVEAAALAEIIVIEWKGIAGSAGVCMSPSQTEYVVAD